MGGVLGSAVRGVRSRRDLPNAFRGNDGLRRLDCPRCGKLLTRFHRSLRGGPVEFKCRASDCGAIERVWFNVGGPAWV